MVTQIQPRRYTVEEYFALEASSDTRYEYHNGDVVAMAGASVKHIRITRNALALLHGMRHTSGCETFGEDARIKIPTTGRYLYADVSVICGKPEYEMFKGLPSFLNPTLIVEVLSPSTQMHDMTAKFTYYTAIPTFSEYLLIQQDRPVVMHYTKQADGSWQLRFVAGLDATLELATMNVTLSMAELYEGVTFEDEDAEVNEAQTSL